MRRGRPLGLDELMIVNPGPPGARTAFLGTDGMPYQVQGLGEPGRFFLGADGMLYQVQGFGLNGLGEDQGRELGRFFLGEDGTLYQMVR
jgi:hypothetical protein